LKEPRPIQAFELIDNPERLIEVGLGLAAMRQTAGYAYLVDTLTRMANETAIEALEDMDRGSDAEHPPAYYLGYIHMARGILKHIEDVILAGDAARDMRDKETRRELGSLSLGGGSTAVG
jgi:hypothetical protein